jgi:hypothetical protein
VAFNQRFAGASAAEGRLSPRKGAVCLGFWGRVDCCPPIAQNLATNTETNTRKTQSQKIKPAEAGLYIRINGEISNLNNLNFADITQERKWFLRILLYA